VLIATSETDDREPAGYAALLAAHFETLGTGSKMGAATPLPWQSE
jgi:hypothetical protein